MAPKHSSAGETLPSGASKLFWVDTHCHLDEETFAEDLAAVVDRACAAGVRAMICPATSRRSSEAVLQLATSYPHILHAAVGIHPNAAAQAEPTDWDQIRSLAQRPGVVAVGETGLDRYRDYTPWEVQKEYLDRHLRLAQELNLPVILHCRDAEEELLTVLHEAAARAPLRGVWHAFAADLEAAYEAGELGLYISFAGSATYRNKKFDLLREAVASVPDDRLLLETDSPYLVPHPLRGKVDRNEPAYVVLVAQGVAQIREEPLEHLSAITRANTEQVFKISLTPAHPTD